MVNCVFSFVALLLVMIFTGAPFHLHGVQLDDLLHVEAADGKSHLGGGVGGRG